MQQETINPPTRVKTGRKPVPPHPNPILAEHGLNATFEDRFWKYVKKTESCWIWVGHLMVDGYGHVAKGPQYAGPIRAHQASWLIHRGRIPNGLWVLHNCPGGDNRACVNPNHLWLGTATDNNRDMLKKVVHVPPCLAGESHPMAKLKWDDVCKIRHIWETKKMTQTEIGRLFGVRQITIARILSGRSWQKPR